MNHGNSTLLKIKKYLITQGEHIKKDQKRQFIFFILGFLLAYIALTALVYSVPEGTFESLTGESVNSLLRAQGLSTTTHAGEVFEILVENKLIIISWLCAGVLEIIILVSAILASFGVSWKKKAVGIIWAIFIGYFFNLLRIIVTINIIFTQNALVFELAHDLLFRLVLFVYIVAFYVIWFYWSTNEEQKQ